MSLRPSLVLRSRRLFALGLGSLALLVPGHAGATAGCVHVRATVALSPADPGQPCASPIGLCAGGVLRGTLRGTSSFVGSSIVPTVDTPATGAVLLTGDNTIHLPDGDLRTKDAIVLNTGSGGEFAEVDTAVGGTGRWAGATGRLTATGTFDAVAGGTGVLTGSLCPA